MAGAPLSLRHRLELGHIIELCGKVGGAPADWLPPTPSFFFETPETTSSTRSSRIADSIAVLIVCVFTLPTAHAWSAGNRFETEMVDLRHRLPDPKLCHVYQFPLLAVDTPVSHIAARMLGPQLCHQPHHLRAAVVRLRSSRLSAPRECSQKEQKEGVPRSSG